MKSEISNPQGVTRSARAKMGIYDNQGSGGQLTGTGRFARVSGPGLENGAVYQRPINSELISNVAFGASPPYAAVVNTYEPNRDLRISVTNLVFTPMSTVSQYYYDHDVIGRRKSVVYTGTAFAENHLFKWGYNDRSELKTADQHQGTNPNSPGNQYTQYGDYDFNYDNIGNRETGTTYMDAGATRYSTAYAANDVNQYTGTTSPTEAFSPDLDGNLILDRQFVYTWDAENRLIEVATRIEWGQSPTAYEVNDKHVYFTYDYMGRRVRKRVETYNGSSWPETGDELFVYDGWNPVLVIDGNATDVNAAAAVTRKYTWGLDLSGTIHGAGGIGGLLACEEPQAPGGPKRYWFFYDANGNVGQVMDATNTGSITIAARYEYDPYGNPIWPDPDNDGDWQEHLDPYTLANPFRFSTKWFDDETGLGNWTFRYYSPRLGRWISRDPAEETGGLNLYRAMDNAPVYSIDLLGLKKFNEGVTLNDCVRIKFDGVARKITDDVQMCESCCNLFKKELIIWGSSSKNPNPCKRVEECYILCGENKNPFAIFGPVPGPAPAPAPAPPITLPPGGGTGGGGTGGSGGTTAACPSCQKNDVPPCRKGYEFYPRDWPMLSPVFECTLSDPASSQVGACCRYDDCWDKPWKFSGTRVNKSREGWVICEYRRSDSTIVRPLGKPRKEDCPKCLK